MSNTSNSVRLVLISLFLLQGEMVWANGIFLAEGAAPRSIINIVSDSTESKRKPESGKVKVWKPKPNNQQNALRHTNLRKDIAESARREQGNSVSTNSYAINDLSSSSNFANVVSFNIYDKKWNVHSFSGTQSFVYKLNFTSENNVNTKRELYGFEYRFKKVDTAKFGYSARLRLERDNEDQTYYQLGVGARINGDKVYNLFGLEHFPVRSGPGHILEIYRTQFVNYSEFQFAKRLQQTASFEGNYYSDEQADFTFLLHTEYLLFDSDMFKVSPLIEGAYGLGTINRRDGYPYWIANKRVYGGGGVALNIGSDTSAFRMIADAALFSEVGHPNFERYTGNLSYRIKDFSTINAGFEVYTIENFYSNVFQLGMVYSFK